MDVNSNFQLREQNEEKLKVLNYCQNCITPVAFGETIVDISSRYGYGMVGHAANE